MDSNRLRSRSLSLAVLLLALTLGSGMHMGAWEHPSMNAAMADTHSTLPSAAAPADGGDCTAQPDCTGDLCAPCTAVFDRLPQLAGTWSESRIPETALAVLSRTTSPEPHPPRS